MITYAGVGSRETPAKIEAQMTKIAEWLNRRGWHLRSGGALGADNAFFQGTDPDNSTIYLPWLGYNRLSGSHTIVLTNHENGVAEHMASDYHPAWDKCSQGARKLHARNAAILYGRDLNDPVSCVICWTENGETKGGTGMAIRLAEANNIPVFNLGNMSAHDVCQELLKIK